MHKPQEQVRDFHRACGLVRPDVPTFDWDEMLGIRFRLMAEELQEYVVACEERDIGEVIDALCDLLYVTYGAAVAAGVDLEPFFEEVQRANMEKCSGPKRDDGKQLKPEGWKEPNHEEVWRKEYDGSLRLATALAKSKAVHLSYQGRVTDTAGRRTTDTRSI
jgi:predicted HAD superfamily Cof-like phosphohydrolase